MSAATDPMEALTSSASNQSGSITVEKKATCPWQWVCIAVAGVLAVLIFIALTKYLFLGGR